MTRRWLRLDAQWDEEPWIAGLSAGAQLAWVKLLARVRRDGQSGKVQALTPVAAAHRWGLSSDDVWDMLNAALKAGRLVCEGGEWRVPGWGRFLPPRLQCTTSAWKRLRRMVLDRDGGVCRYCGAQANQADHVVPRAQGGADDMDNLVAACRPCNSSKNARTPEEWRA